MPSALSRSRPLFYSLFLPFLYSLTVSQHNLFKPYSYIFSWTLENGLMLQMSSPLNREITLALIFCLRLSSTCRVVCRTGKAQFETSEKRKFEVALTCRLHRKTVSPEPHLGFRGESYFHQLPPRSGVFISCTVFISTVFWNKRRWGHWSARGHFSGKLPGIVLCFVQHWKVYERRRSLGRTVWYISLPVWPFFLYSNHFWSHQVKNRRWISGSVIQ